jgi:hypothetical protein
VESEVIGERECFGFIVEVLDVGVSGASGDDSEGCVLDGL